MSLQNEIKEHEQFIKHTKQYILECLCNGSDIQTILESFRKIINETIPEYNKIRMNEKTCSKCKNRLTFIEYKCNYRDLENNPLCSNCYDVVISQ